MVMMFMWCVAVNARRNVLSLVHFVVNELKKLLIFIYKYPLFGKNKG